jgi:hypothetical protein
MDEAMVCRLMAFIRQEWPDEFRSKPKLRLVGGKDVEKLAEVPEQRQNIGWNRPRPLERLLAAKRGIVG